MTILIITIIMITIFLMSILIITLIIIIIIFIFNSGAELLRRCEAKPGPQDIRF